MTWTEKRRPALLKGFALLGMVAGLCGSQDEDVTKMPPWMYDHNPDTGWPPDMGYWIGYRIDQSVYAQAKDKIAALRRMLHVTEFKAFLMASGYPDKVSACMPQTPVHAQ